MYVIYDMTPRAANAAHNPTVAVSRSHFARQWDEGGTRLCSHTSKCDDGVPSSAHISNLLTPTVTLHRVWGSRGPAAARWPLERDQGIRNPPPLVSGQTRADDQPRACPVEYPSRPVPSA